MYDWNYMWVIPDYECKMTISCRYEECFDVYRDIIKNSTDDYEEERETNLAAVVANLCLENSVSRRIIATSELDLLCCLLIFYLYCWM